MGLPWCKQKENDDTFTIRDMDIDDWGYVTSVCFKNNNTINTLFHICEKPNINCAIYIKKISENQYKTICGHTYVRELPDKEKLDIAIATLEKMVWAERNYPYSYCAKETLKKIQ